LKQYKHNQQLTGKGYHNSNNGMW